VTQPLAPGAQIFVGSGRDAEQCGVGAVVTSGGVAYLVTCGHVFASGETDVRVELDGAVVATLTRSYFDEGDPLDAALCQLTDAGHDLLDESGTADTWFQNVHAPAASDNGKLATFWPTDSAPAQATPIQVKSFSACNPVPALGGARCGYILMPFGALGGDSGSVLAIGDAHYGICSFQVAGSQTFFTPTTSILKRFAVDFGGVTLWNPNAG
jgi:hypothetical protein